MSDDTMKLYGTNPDGSTTLIGTVQQSPGMKMRDICRNYFGEPSCDDNDTSFANEADSCLYALQDYHQWLSARLAKPVEITLAKQDVVEWQYSANGGEWRKIVPPRGETMEGRIAYLRAHIRANGVPTFRIRGLAVVHE